jgi:hypothetical protein
VLLAPAPSHKLAQSLPLHHPCSLLQGAAGVLYFWSFMILVFMILLNFLLAIIVDAFSEIKGATKERTGAGSLPPHVMSRRSALHRGDQSPNTPAKM